MSIKDRKNQVVYHGTAQKFQVPDLSHTRGQKDFGVGFYLTTDKAQAEEFAKIQSRRERVNTAYINQYYIESFEGLKVKEFDGANEEWLRFICANRTRKLPKHGYDIIIGKIADDDTRITLEQYLAGLFIEPARQMGSTPEQFAINTLRTDRLKNQLCVCTEAGILRLKFIKATVVR